MFGLVLGLAFAGLGIGAHTVYSKIENLKAPLVLGKTPTLNVADTTRIYYGQTQYVSRFSDEKNTCYIWASSAGPVALSCLPIK